MKSEIWNLIRPMQKNSERQETMKMVSRQSLVVLIAEDDPDDRLIIQEAIEGSVSSVEEGAPSREGGATSFEYRFVGGGDEVMPFLESSLDGDADRDCPLPALILLDLNLPKKDGREILREIKAHSVFRAIPVIVLTTSSSPEDIAYSYDSGANSYIVKPADFEAMRDIMQTLKKYWFDVIKLP